MPFFFFLSRNRLQCFCTFHIKDILEGVGVGWGVAEIRVERREDGGRRDGDRGFFFYSPREQKSSSLYKMVLIRKNNNHFLLFTFMLGKGGKEESLLFFTASTHILTPAEARPQVFIFLFFKHPPDFLGMGRGR